MATRTFYTVDRVQRGDVESIDEHIENGQYISLEDANRDAVLLADLFPRASIFVIKNREFPDGSIQEDMIVFYHRGVLEWNTETGYNADIERARNEQAMESDEDIETPTQILNDAYIQEEQSPDRVVDLVLSPLHFTPIVEPAPNHWMPSPVPFDISSPEPEVIDLTDLTDSEDEEEERELCPVLWGRYHGCMCRIHGQPLEWTNYGIQGNAGMMVCPEDTEILVRFVEAGDENDPVHCIVYNQGGLNIYQPFNQLVTFN